MLARCHHQLPVDAFSTPYGASYIWVFMKEDTVTNRRISFFPNQLFKMMLN